MKYIRKIVRPEYANFSPLRLLVLTLVLWLYGASILLGIKGIVILIDILLHGEYERLPILALLLIVPLHWLKNYISSGK